MSKGERIILKDDKGKQYELIRVLELDTEKIINDLSALVVKKDKMIDEMAQELIDQQVRAFKDNFDPFKYINKEQVKKYFEERCK